MNNINSPAPALSRGLDILDIISKHGSVGFNDIVEKLNLNSSSVNRLLKVLLQYGYIAKNFENKYELGLKAYALAQKESSWRILINECNPILKNLNESFGVTSILVGYDEKEMICLDKSANVDNISLMDQGKTLRNYLSRPWGIIFLSALKGPLLSEFIEYSIPYTKEKTIVPPRDTIEGFIDFFIKNGYADDMGIITKKTRRISVPIYNHNNKIIASISIGTFSGYLTDKLRLNIINYLKESSKYISSISK
ncbi:MAG: IclR family transcriptional regulator [Clostridiaceae bacterium]|nr:IclR family transcriptional regulator [Clostridiaceae bacterium]